MTYGILYLNRLNFIYIEFVIILIKIFLFYLKLCKGKALMFQYRNESKLCCIDRDINYIQEYFTSFTM